MSVFISVCLLFSLSTATLCYPDQWLHNIYVNSQRGVNNPSCWERGYSTPCLSLNLALQGAQHYNNSTAILLQPGQHQLHSGSETQLRNISQLTIVGNGSQGEVVIRCGPLAGLSFYQSEDIEMRNVSIVGCGAVQNSTSRNPKTGKLITIQVAVFVRNTNNINLTNVHINNSASNGLVLYNVADTVIVSDCLFSSNGQPLEQRELLGGGGLAIETGSKLQARFMIERTLFIDNMAASGHFVTVTPSNALNGYFSLGRGGGVSVVFREGTANNIAQFSEVRMVRNMAQFGGAVYLALHGSASNNTVTMNGCQFADNEALLSHVDIATSNSGGGVFVAYYMTDLFGTDNVLSISATNFTSNKAGYGGGFSLEVQNGHNNLPGNMLLLKNCMFDSNSGFQGSSAYFSKDIESDKFLSLADTVITDTTFSNGQCHVSTFTQFGLPCSGNVDLHSYSLLLNGTISFRDNQLPGLLMSASLVELVSGTDVYFINNTALQGAGLHLDDCSVITVNNATSMLFHMNSAALGGGAIYAKSCDISQTGGRECFIRHANKNLHPDHWQATFTFIGNTGLFNTTNAMYVNSIRPCIWSNTTNHVEDAGRTFCWIGWNYSTSYSEIREDCLSHLRSAPAFVNVSAISNLTVFPGRSINLLKLITVTDDWGRDKYYETINVQVLSGPALLQYNNTYERSRSLAVLPSETRPIEFITECGGNTTYDGDISVVSVGPLQLSSTISVKFKSCQNAISLNGTSCITTDGCLQHIQGFIGCDSCASISHYAFNDTKCSIFSNICVQSGACLSVDASNKLFSGPCPTLYSNITWEKPFISLPIQDLSSLFPNLSHLTCAPHREGRLCGQCSEGYGVAFNSPEFVCVPCESYGGGAIYLFLGILPVFALMTTLAVLHINITNGRLNGFILFSQLVTLQFPGLGYPSWVFKNYFEKINLGDSSEAINYGFLSVYSIWNLNFLGVYPPFCIRFVDTAAKAIALQYVTAICPLLFIVVSYIWIRLYSHGYKYIVLVSKPVHKVLARFWQRFKIQPSLIDTYAGLVILSYMRFVETSVKLLKFTIVVPTTDTSLDRVTAFFYDANLLYFGWPHAAYAVLAILCLLMFVFPLIFFFLFYHLAIFQQCFSLCKLDRPGLRALVDSYQGCFKNSARDGVERRYFAGIYLLVRLYIILLVSMYVSPVYRTKLSLSPILLVEIIMCLFMAGLISLFRPYKKLAHNAIDFMLFFYMGLVAFISINTNASAFFEYFAVYMPITVLIIYLLSKLIIFCCIRCNCKRKKFSILSDCKQLLEARTVQKDQNKPSHVHVVTKTEVVLSSYIADEEYADRVMNPGGYNEQHTSYLSVDEDTKLIN